MPAKTKSGKAKDNKAEKAESQQLPDIYENWLAKQKVREVRARAGFISETESEEA